METEGASRRLWRALVVHRFAAIGLADALFWVLSIVSGLALRYEFDVPAHAWSSAWPAIIAVVVAQLVLGTITGTYTGRFQLGSFEEVLGLVISIGGATAVLVIMDATWNVVPLSILVLLRRSPSFSPRPPGTPGG